MPHAVRPGLSQHRKEYEMNETDPTTTPNDPTPDNHEEPSCMLSVRIPEAAKQNAKIAAIKSNLPFKHYVAQVLLHATPVDITENPQTPSTAESLDREGDPPMAAATTEPDPEIKPDHATVNYSSDDAAVAQE